MRKQFPKKRIKWLDQIFFCLLVVGCTNVFAQLSPVTINGNIIENGPGIPIAGVSVYIENTSYGAVTDFNGDYSLTAELENKDYTLVASYLGFTTQKITIRPTSDQINLDIRLTEDLLSLDEVVVTGTGTGANKRSLGNAISSVKSEDLTNNAATQVDQAIAGKVSGALVQQNSGDPAGGISIRLRGPSTISGSSDPLYIVDGIIISNSSNELIDLGGNSQNRLADLNPNDIDKIEIIKGAAAAAIYGSRASNGVVQIFTKKGKTGKAKFTFMTNTRLNELRKNMDYNTVPLAWEVSTDRNNLTTVPVERYNLQDFIFDSGFGLENYFSVNGGNEKTSYFLSASHLDNEGIVKSTNFKRYGIKANITQEAFNWLDITGGFNYIRSVSDDVPNGGINSAYGALTGFLFSDNSIDPRPDASGVYPVTSPLVARTNPLEAVDRFNFNQKTNRFITSITLDGKFNEHLTAKYTLGMDFYNQSAFAFIPINNTSTVPDGFSRRSDLNSFQHNSDLNLSYRTAITDDLNSITTLGGSWQYEERDRVGINATGLPPVVQTATGGSIVEQGESRSQISYWGGFLQQSFSYRDKVYLNGALRMDGASTFGKDERNQLYFKASGSYVVSDEDYWKNTFSESFNSFKIRASWGQAGNLTALGAFDRFSVYNPSSISGAVSLVPSTAQGNENLKPERQDEIELGFDAGLLNNRLGLEFSYYHQKVTDLLLPRVLAPSSGFSSRFENVGNLENKGIEILLRAAPIKNENLIWDITATFSKNKNEVTNVAGGGRLTLSGSFATNYVIEGEPLGVFYRQFYAREADGSISLDENGYPFRGTTEDGESSKVLGDPNPDWFGSLINEVKYKDFTFRVQFDAVQGYDVFNWNRRLLDNVIFGGGYNVGQELLGNLPKGYGSAQANIFEEFVEDGSFVKLREVSLSYNLVPKWDFIDNVEISLVGRNLVSWDDYSGWDPEVSAAGQSNGVRGFDFATVPIPKTYQLGVNVSF
ncbi:SusC/RagA family TonB-linked outer membrane protein [Arenibacter amylolyticus]|uniref:SusC/RagA family TonB-linked outer membrane protein n=1 Tax=Arenibacter amylolyticus TaxID=1406873 RepID=UPI000A378D5C|nr:SusC/RagA family TonB-linked outer membrane protein [Arenibacter amylolyticus]